jgi:ATP-dependent helicase/DNAse subunit B
MPLTLVTGPANAAKAGEVLGGLRARLGDDPVLVVPSFQDVEHAQRELADAGAVFGARVLRFGRLFREIADRAGYDEPVASRVQRELLVEAAIEEAGLRVLADSAARPGFVRAAVRLVAELGRARVDPGRFTRALRSWAAESGRRAYADEVAAIHRGYRAGLERSGLADPELYAWRALDAARRSPECWGGTPVFVYGFDDFTPLELDALDTLAGACGAEVTVSLPFEPGRLAFKAVAGVHAELSAIAAERRELPPLDDHYAPGSRPALHAVERGLFGSDPGRAADPRAAVVFHAAGGARAEVELAGARVLELLRDGVAPGDVAVVFRDPTRHASLVEQVFGAYGVPFSLDRSLPLGHTGVGRGLLALVRCADGRGSAEDLLAYLRTPGLLTQPALADRLEAAVRRDGAHSAEQARALWERANWKLEELDRLAGAATTAQYVRELRRQLERLFAAPYRRRAAVLAGPELEEARAYADAREALEELGALVERDRRRSLDRRRVQDVLAALRVHVGENPQPDRVQVARPEAIRARRFQAVLVLGLQEGEFPAGSPPEPFLPDDVRRELATASGLVLPMREDRLDRERYLFYVCASRAERLLVLSHRTSDEEGALQVPSFFLDDVRRLLRGDGETTARSLADVTWDPELAPTAAEWDRSLAARGPRRAERRPGPLTAAPVLAELAAAGSVSAGAIEAYADCPVKWFVEKVLRPEPLEPDPEALVRGAYAHAVLEHTYRRLRDETGQRRVRRSNLAAAERILLEELRSQRGEYRISPQRTRVAAAVRRLEFDLLRHLAAEADSDSRLEPELLELRFGEREPTGPVEIAPGVMVRGRVDRVDTSDGLALVVDYKSGRRVDTYKVASWEPENRFQAALYMLAVERLTGKRPVGGVYVALGGDDRRPRGMLARGVEELGSGWVDTDLLDAEHFEAKLEWARGRIRETAESMRAGELRCTPASCAYGGGCSHPSICRTGA